MSKQITQKNNTPLSKHAISYTSYDGEDGILLELFKRIGTRNKWCLEFGARDGKLASNTWNLIENNDWSAVLIECNHFEATELKKRYAESTKVVAVEKMVKLSGKDCLDNILLGTIIPMDFDLAVIDVDSIDYHIWKSIKKFSPRVVMIEYNDRIPYNMDWVQPLEGPATGSSFSSIKKLGEKLDYKLVYAKHGNAIFIQASDFNAHKPEFFAEDVDISSIAESENLAGSFLQAMDGSLILFDLVTPQKLLKRAGTQKLKSSQVYVMDNNRVLSQVRPYRELRLVRRFKSFLKSTEIGRIVYLPVRKFYSWTTSLRERRILAAKNKP